MLPTIPFYPLTNLNTLNSNINAQPIRYPPHLRAPHLPSSPPSPNTLIRVSSYLWPTTNDIFILIVCFLPNQLYQHTSISRRFSPLHRPPSLRNTFRHRDEAMDCRAD